MTTSLRLAGLLACALLAADCGSDGGGQPTSPSGPSPTPVARATVPDALRVLATRASYSTT